MSQFKSMHTWNPYRRIEIYKSDSRLLDNLDVRTREILFDSLDEIEAFTLSWSIENQIAIRQANSRKICVVCYETLLEEGASEWMRVVTALGLPTVPSTSMIAKPSQQAWGAKSTDAELVRRYEDWMEKIDGQTSKKIQKVLDATGMDLYSVDSPLPNNSVVKED